MTSRRVSMVTCVVAALLIVGGMGCLGSARVAANQRIPIRIGWQPDPNAAFYLAREGRLFQKAGLEPTYLKFLAGPPMFAALESGSIDETDLGMSPFVAAISQGIPIKGIMVLVDVTPTNALVVRTGSGIRTLQDLRGKRVAATKGSGTYYAMMKGLAKVGMTLKDIHFIDMATPAMVPAFRKGEIDAAWAWSPWLDLMAQSNGTIISDGTKVDAYAPEILAVRTAFLKDNRDAVIRSVRAFAEALANLQSNKQRAASAMAQVFGIDQQTAMSIMDRDYYPTVQEQISSTYTLSFTNGGLERALANAATFFYSEGFVKKQPDVTAVLDTSVLKIVASGRR